MLIEYVTRLRRSMRLRLLTSVMIFTNLGSVAGSAFSTEYEYSYLTTRQNIWYQEDSVLNL